MKKGMLTSIICFSSLLFSSCGRTKVNVKLTGDEYIGWEKTSDIASVNKDYYVKAYSKVKGYTLYSENLDIKIGGVPAYEGEQYAYTYDEKTLTLRIKEKAIIGDIEINGKGEMRQSEITFVIKDATHKYKQISSQTIISVNIDDEVEIDVTADEQSYQPEAKTEIEISPTDVKFTFNENQDYKLIIPKGECYTDIVITLP